MDFEKIIGIVIGLLIAFVVALLVFAFVCEANTQERLEICYKQEPRTKDCEFFLWKYENRQKTSTVAVPVFIPH